MKKLKLMPEEIQVTGFEVVAPETDGAGTVNAAELLTIRTRCDGYDSCPDTCTADCL